MQITVFRKKVTPRNGNKPFFKYVTTMTKKDGEKVYADVMFEDGVTIPSTFPCVIDLDKKQANLNSKDIDYTDEKTGEEKNFIRNTLWVKGYNNISEYIDTSLDDFD